MNKSIKLAVRIELNTKLNQKHKIKLYKANQNFTLSNLSVITINTIKRCCKGVNILFNPLRTKFFFSSFFRT